MRFLKYFVECNAISQQRVHVNVCMCTELGAHTPVIMFLYLHLAHGSVKFRIFVHVCLWLHEYVYFMVLVCYICLCMCVCIYIYVHFTCTYLCMGIYTFMCICIFECMYICILLCLNECSYVCTYSGLSGHVASGRWQPCCDRSRPAGDWQLDQFYLVK